MSDIESSPTDIEVQDATKHTWDLWEMHDDGKLYVVDTLTSFLNVQGLIGLPEDEQREAVLNFTHLPAWKPAPDALKQEVKAWLTPSESE